MFVFTFTDAGSYVFTDYTTTQKMMMITVMGAGQACADPDRFVQSISGNALSEFGMPQSDEIIIKPDYPLLICMGCLLVLSTGIVMVLISYCLHKQWTIREVKPEGYRLKHAKIDIRHSNEATYGKATSDFVKHKSRPDDESSGEEDDLDDINMDIYQDLVDAGKQLLEAYETVRNRRKKREQGKRSQLLRLLRELEKEVGSVGHDAVGNDMQLFDPAEFDDPSASLEDNEKAQERAERLRKLQEEREAKERAAE